MDDITAIPVRIKIAIVILCILAVKQGVFIMCCIRKINSQPISVKVFIDGHEVSDVPVQVSKCKKMKKRKQLTRKAD